MTKDRWIGAGIGYRHMYREALLGADPSLRPEVLEVIPDHFFGRPDELAELSASYPVVFHEVSLSATTDIVDDEQSRKRFKRVLDLALIARPRMVTTHLAVTRSREFDLGHLAPVWYTNETLRVVIDNVRRWQDMFNLPVALENITIPFVFGASDMPEAEFMTRIVEATGSEVLLDVTNLGLNAKNFDFDPFSRLCEYPLAAVTAVHLAGGRIHGGVWVDTHDQPVDGTSLALLEGLRGRARLRAIVVERDGRMPELGALVAEARSAATVWAEVRTTVCKELTHVAIKSHD